MKVFLIGCAMLGAIPAIAQKNTLKGADKFGKTITAAELKHHLYIVASPEMEGRETATEGQRKAAAYIEKYFREYGLTPGNGDNYQQVFEVYTEGVESAELKINGYNAVADKDFAFNLNTNHTATQYFSEVVYLNEGNNTDAQNDYKDIDVKGKLVLIRVTKPASKIPAAIKNGAAAVLLVQTSLQKSMQKTGMSVNLYRKSVGPNVYTITPAMAEKIMGADWAAAQAGTAPVKSYPAEIKFAFTKKVNVLESTNVLGVVEGSDKKEEYVFVTAHYDHIGKENGVVNAGADDDGSGTVAILEMAQAFAEAKKAGKGPRRSVVFMAVSGEEKGLWGSAYYSNHPIFPLENTVADLNIDMIGRVGFEYQKSKDSGNYIYVIGDDKLSSDLRPVSEAANKQFVKMKLDYKYNDPKDPNRFYYRSDHYNFAVKGVPVIFYFNGVHQDYHRPGDTPDKINYELTEKRARLVFYTAWEMANREERIKRDIPLN